MRIVDGCRPSAFGKMTYTAPMAENIPSTITGHTQTTSHIYTPV